MAPSGGPSSSFGGGVPPLAALTEDEVQSWNRTQLHTALFEYQLLSDVRHDEDTESLRARLVAHVRAQTAAHHALGQQPSAGRTTKTPSPAAVPSRPGATLPRYNAQGAAFASLVTPLHGSRALSDASDGDLPSVPFGQGPYAKPRHCVSPSAGRSLEDAFAAVEDSPLRDNLFAALDQADTRHEDAERARARANWTTRPLTALDFVGPRGDMDTYSEVSMGVPEDEMYRPRVPKRRMADRSPQHLQDYCGRTSRVPCRSPPDAVNGEQDILVAQGSDRPVAPGARFPPPEDHGRSEAHPAPDASPRSCRTPPPRPAYADPSKLTRRQCVLLRGLPLRPSLSDLMGLSDITLQCLLFANDLRRGHGATKQDYAHALRDLLERSESTVLSLPEGIERSRGPSPSDHSRRSRHRPLSVSPGPRRTSPLHHEPPPKPGASKAPPPSPRRRSPAPRPREAHARRPSDRRIPSEDITSDTDALRRLRPTLAFAERALAECVRYLRALPGAAPDRDAALALASDAERAHDQVRAAHGGMAAGALDESLRVATATRRSYASVCGGGGGGDDTRPTGQRHPRQTVPVNRSTARTSTTQHSTGRTPGSIAPTNPAWDTARSVIFSPRASDARKAPTRIQTFIQATEALARHKLPSLAPIPTGRLIELARRTRRGDYVIQFWPNAWALLQPTLTTPQAWELGAPLGLWHSQPSSAQPPLSAIVLSGIDTSWTEAALLQEIKATNAHRFPDSDLDGGLRRVIRLNRRNPEASSGSRTAAPWIPSRSVKIIGEATLCTAILEIGALSVGCELRSPRLFEPSPRACPRCLQYGHQLRFCRNAPLCRFCHEPHLSSACPRQESHGPSDGSHGARPHGGISL